MRRTIIHPWTPEWKQAYQQEKQRLIEIFKDELIHIYHIGSTSISTVGYAKPIIDILIAVQNINAVDYYNNQMTDIGYDPRGEFGISGRRYFPKGGDNRTHHVHIFQVGNEAIATHLNFKRYLLLHPEEAKQYGSLKKSLAKKFPDDTHLYQEGKEAFVNELAEKANDWARKNRGGM